MSDALADGGVIGRAGPRRLRPKRLAQVIAIALVLALLGLLIWRVARGEAGGAFVAAVRAGERLAPDFALPVIWKHDETWPPETRRALADGTVALRELRGFPVVLSFWASWCIPCTEEAPELAAAARRYRGRVVFLGIDIQDFTSDARKFMDDVDAPSVSVRDGTSGTSSAYGITGLSTDDLEVSIRAALKDAS